jgi:DNA modification methylase
MNKVFFGDCRASLQQMKADGIKVQMCVTSPPYFGLRDYGHDGQIGMEETPEQFIAALVEVFRGVRDVLADDGILWLNIGDSYASNPASGGNQSSKMTGGEHKRTPSETKYKRPAGLKQKDLIGIPWMLAFALRADGWYLRCDIIWAKPNPMPESVTDRPTKSHEYLFLLSKSATYYYDHDAIKEPMSMSSVARLDQDVESQAGSTRANGGAKTNGNMKAVGDKQRGHSRRHAGFNDRWDAMEKAEQCSGMRNKRSVWTVATKPYTGAHFATYPPELIEPCILAGSRVGDIVLDPFFGSGTTGEVALNLGRQYIGCELNPAYEPLQIERTRQPSLLLVSA